MQVAESEAGQQTFWETRPPPPGRREAASVVVLCGVEVFVCV